VNPRTPGAEKWLYLTVDSGKISSTRQ